jgi:hypothetical protein
MIELLIILESCSDCLRTFIYYLRKRSSSDAAVADNLVDPSRLDIFGHFGTVSGRNDLVGWRFETEFCWNHHGLATCYHGYCYAAFSECLQVVHNEYGLCLHMFRTCHYDVCLCFG